MLSKAQLQASSRFGIRRGLSLRTAPSPRNLYPRQPPAFVRAVEARAASSASRAPRSEESHNARAPRSEESHNARAPRSEESHDAVLGRGDWAERRKRLRAARVQHALQAGTLGLGFSAGGFLYGYHLGVLWELTRLKVMPPPGHSDALKLAGSSAGSLAIVTYACGLDVDVATHAMLRFADDCRKHGTLRRVSSLLRSFLHELLPEDAHKRCEGLVHVGLTRVFPVWTPETVSKWNSKDDLVECLVASCHVPVYANGDFMTSFRGRWYMDGGWTGFIPKPPGVHHTVKVCCFPFNSMIERVAHPTLEDTAPRVASILDIHISPDAAPADWDFVPSLPQFVAWAFVPAEDEILKKLISKGRRDAHAWAVSMGLVPSSVEAGKELQPVQGEAAAQRELATAASMSAASMRLQKAKERLQKAKSMR
ncbi:acyl transferase/acyl hydrolase/lysophospholipase [Dunaliella salina]|uniref:Patatin n=1 Tax=Dunaliella salina TaxID=3046 RepID=A0ABQ7G743_DUNSA|nr:acyl transferase/acyl hydrolase/lysophospholipase [Dunaliella salina]|eukprot:KAF5830417.1 acyl transferase/acyl hydrolase/lysophospholipase [Dunaliella salina]